jgi:hypothetical protein
MGSQIEKAMSSVYIQGPSSFSPWERISRHGDMGGCKRKESLSLSQPMTCGWHGKDALRPGGGGHRQETTCELACERFVICYSWLVTDFEVP